MSLAENRMSKHRLSVLWIGLILFLFLPACSKGAPRYVAGEGDIIFHTSRSSQSLAIQRATNSKFSHVGIVTLRGAVPFVFEAVDPVKYTPLEEWIAQGEGEKFVVKRLKDAPEVLTSGAIEKLRAVEKTFVGKPYDLTFAWSDDRIYCSELVWKVYDRALGIEVGRLQRLKDFNLKDPAVQAKLKERYGDSVPLEETVISPSSIYESKMLETVAKK
jgi:Permuted papain-like amidase enzyme, YaeF/YiiX, C92 family